MGLPIAVGTKSVSSRPIAPSEPIEEYGFDEIVVKPVIYERKTPLVALATSADQQLQATVTLTYYDMIRENNHQNREYTVAEIRVQVSPLGEPFSSIAYRDILYRIRLPESSSGAAAEACQSPNQRIRLTNPMVVFSADRKYLSCLVPFPQSENSVVVVFQLRRPRSLSSNTKGPPPIPSYILGADKQSVPVATNPRLLKHEGAHNQALLNATSLCDVSLSKSTTNGPCFLLVGCRDGCILAVSYRPLLINGVFCRLLRYGGGIKSMDYLTEEHDDRKQVGTGKLVAVRENGQATIFQTYHVPDKSQIYVDSGQAPNDSTQTIGDAKNALVLHTVVADFRINAEEAWHLEEPIACATWISRSYLATIQCYGKKSIAQVHGLYADGRISSISTMEMTKDRLDEDAHTMFVIDSHVGSSEDGTRISTAEVALTVGLDYDRTSDCLAVSSVLYGANVNASDLDGSSIAFGAPQPFVCLWSWRVNVQGLTIVPSKSHSTAQYPASSFLISRLFFASNETNKRKMAHIVACVSSGTNRIRKELYDTGVLSPSADRLCGSRMQQAASLLLSSSSVAYPCVSSVSSSGEFEVEWQEARIPANYLASRGCPAIATVGRRRGRSIAVSSARGVCALDLSSDIGPSAASSSRPKIGKASPAVPKWSLFGNETEEDVISVLTMTWWEGMDATVSPIDDVLTEDVLLAVIKIDTPSEKGIFLSCWSPKMFDLGHQLLRSVCDSPQRESSQWGIRLPNNFECVSLDVLEQPYESIAGSSGGKARKAVALIATDSNSTGYQLYQLQLIPEETSLQGSYFERQPYYALGRCSSESNIGLCSDIFLASASFCFNLGDERDGSETFENGDYYVATLGIVRGPGGGVDALAVSATAAVAVGQVLPPLLNGESSLKASELSRFWLADILCGRNGAPGTDLDFIVWNMQLDDGRLVSWSLPLTLRIDGYRRLSEAVHDTSLERFSSYESFGSPLLVHTKSVLLGTTCMTGSTSTWMQQSSSRTRKDFSVGCVPGTSFGCVLSAGQSSRKLHRSLGEDFERQYFRSDFLDHDILCPGDFILSPPSFMPSLYALFLGLVHPGTSIELGKPRADEHVRRRLDSCPYRDSVIMALQLLILRLVEKNAAIGQNRGPQSAKASDVNRIYTSAVDVVRRLTTPMQFASLFLEVGRQLEPSCFLYLFPLPMLKAEGEGSESIDHLFDTVVAYGSISVSVAALPLFFQREATKSCCSLIFHHCLLTIEASYQRGFVSAYDDSDESKLAIGDIFRYGIKLDNPEDEDAGGTNGSSGEFVTYDDEVATERGYSFTCGLSRWFKRAKNKEELAIVDAASSFIVHGFENGPADNGNGPVRPDTDRGGPSNGFVDLGNGFAHFDTSRLGREQAYARDGTESVVRMVALHLLTLIFDSEASTDQRRWKRAAASATLLLGESLKGYYRSSRAFITRHAQRTPLRAFQSFLPKEKSRRGRLALFFLHSIDECGQQTNPRSAGAILDLVLILLANEDVSGDLKAEVPGLLLIAVVVGHTAGRMADLLEEGRDDHPLWSSYLEANFEMT